ncbi:MAG: helix-turn-helix transcriptional regulator [Bacillota bacterium]|nr:helix-turn-helix transcriptional regulator [Bacillota bacterium]
MSSELGKYIEFLRNEKNMSQRQLADKAGISNTEVWRIESGERKNPTPAVLKALAPHLDISYEDLMIKAGYIEETIDHSGYTEKVFRDDKGNVVDILRRAKEMYEKDSDWANIAYRVSKELSTDDIAAIKAVAKSLLSKQTDVKKQRSAGRRGKTES